MSDPSPDSITVLIPCYNAAEFLPQALDSALAQTRRPEQIVIVDDGSTDASAAIAADYLRRYPDRGLELLRQANQGEVAARNTGIRAARGAWVAMLDADDWWEPRKLEAQIAAAHGAGPECVMVHTGAFVEHPDGRSVPADLDVPARRTGWCLAALLEPGSINHASILVRRGALARIGGYDRNFPHACDVNLYFNLLTVGTFAFVPERLLHYRMHAGQTSFNFKLEQTRYHYRAVTEFFGQHPELEARIGRAKVAAELARFLDLKLESLYWRRRLNDFRALLHFADEKGVDSPGIRRWRRRAWCPDWLIRMKDRIE
jgi:glycosyltransferase involved in cell wall biosynthesis